MAVFQSKKSQHNFRSNFTPPKNSAFSHHQLQSLKFSAANFLTDMFSRVATIDSATEFEKNDLDEMLQSYCCEETKINVYPFGYHTDWKPDPNKVCDMPSCSKGNTDEEWKINEGCWHSFHTTCLKNLSHCPICRAHIRKETKKLALAAIKGIVGQGEANDNAPSPSSEKTEEVMDDDLKAAKIKATNGQIFAKGINALHNKIEELNPLSPLQTNSAYQNFAPAKQNKKPPHCKTCGHTKRVTNRTRKRNLLNAPFVQRTSAAKVGVKCLARVIGTLSQNTRMQQFF